MIIITHITLIITQFYPVSDILVNSLHGLCGSIIHLITLDSGAIIIPISQIRNFHLQTNLKTTLSVMKMGNLLLKAI